MKRTLLILLLLPVIVGRADALELDQGLLPHLQEMSIHHRGTEGTVQTVLYDDSVALMRDGGDPTVVDFPEGKRQELEAVRAELVRFFNEARVLSATDRTSVGRFTVTIHYRSAGTVTAVFEDFAESRLSSDLHRLFKRARALAGAKH